MVLATSISFYFRCVDVHTHTHTHTHPFNSALSGTTQVNWYQKEYYSSLISSASDNLKHLWQTVNKLLHRKSSSPHPITSPGTSLADSFASFFTGKTSKLRLSLTSNPTTPSPHSPSTPATPPDCSIFTPASESKVSRETSCEIEITRPMNSSTSV